MAEQGNGGGANERVSIRQSAKFHKKYGSTTTNIMKARSNESYVKHIVSHTDTLQGIALKYGVSMEQIRRVNKIWANDSLFLRCTLDIPIASASLDSICWEETNGGGGSSSGGSGSSRSGSHRSRNCGDDGRQLGTCKLSNGSEHPVVSVNGPQQLQRRNSAPEASGLVPDSSDTTIADILIRIDSSIAQTRSQVERREKLQEFTSDDDMYSPRHNDYNHHYVQSRVRRSLTQNSSYERCDPHATTTVQPTASMAQNRRVKSSLQRLQREQDEMFEL